MTAVSLRAVTHCALFRRCLTLPTSPRSSRFPSRNGTRLSDCVCSKPSIGKRGSRGWSAVDWRRGVVSMAATTEPSVLVPIATGTEEMEAVITIDVLRRAGAQVVIASIEEQLGVVCSRGVKLEADVKLESVVNVTFDMVALPGGAEGAERFSRSTELKEVVHRHRDKGMWVTAICASPAVVLEPMGMLKGMKATAHPAFTDRLSDTSWVHLWSHRVECCYRKAEERVVIDGKMVTSRGPGTAFEFALTLVELLFGEEKRKQVANPMVLYDYSLPGLPAPARQ